MPTPTILMVDDSETNRKLTGKLIARLGYRCTFAVNGVDALAACETERPDLILMDVSMPEMDGLEATAKLRSLFGEDWIPIIFLTSHNELSSIIAGLAAGGDDYLSKPVHFDLLCAKIKVFLRIADMKRQIGRDAARLEKYYEDNEAEQALALELLQRLSQRSSIALPHIWHRLSPAENFSGDLICRAATPSGAEHFMLADCTGHGLTAAISALPAIDGFHELVQQYLSTSLLASGINKKLNTLLPTGRFVAAALVSIDYTARTLSVWNGGIPCVLLFSANGEVREELPSFHPPLGILSEDTFDPTVKTFGWSEGDVLIMSSDGITEASNDTAAMFGVGGIKAAVRKGWPDKVGPSILDALTEHLHGAVLQDDVSLLMVRCQTSAYGTG
ncbi:PP2C family protein-serine/threonine phosphatase [Paludibacterium paludis]|uniref:Response regulatory domain-containing protein n=1 Tax=Paludibacterium paludis TaxID=1225769 RepID=A0A918UBK5_9NEIS|nr:SpoIIE family protein phosphatase [Paludibacterium paludis]GGY24822.1 hypothetical protein GCM10011289_30570 [Paludibacterium paludis]